MEKHIKILAREQSMRQHTNWRNIAWARIGKRVGVQAAVRIASRMPIAFDVMVETHLAKYVVNHCAPTIPILIHTN